MAAKVVAILVVVAVVAQANIIPLKEEYHAPQPYSFGYTVKDKHGEQHRQETGDGHSNVKGSYGFTDDRGVHRQVEYVADKAGFRAQVKTNEPGTANQDPAAVNIVSSAHPYFGGAGAGAFAGGAGAGAFAGGAAYPAAAGGYAAPVGLGEGGYGYGNVKRYDSRENVGLF